jgi:hypothetical protein
VRIEGVPKKYRSKLEQMSFEKNSLRDFLAMYEALRKYATPFNDCSESVREVIDSAEDADIERFNHLRNSITGSIRKRSEWGDLDEGS